MTIHELHDAPPPPLAAALATFEARFTYPLGHGRTFSISHGDDYPRFLRSTGDDARCFVAERDGRVIGALGVSLRRLTLPDGTDRRAAYVGDLKVDPDARSPTAFARLARAADAWARPRVTAAFGVVMDGTAVAPADYTGRAGVEPFAAVATVAIRRLPTDADAADACAVVADAADLFATLAAGRTWADGGDPAERSDIAPRWIVHPGGLACGRLEDTRRAKRLTTADGQEMVSGHLARLAWRTPAAAESVIQSARAHAARLGLPALFLSLPDADALPSTVGGTTTAAATVYAAGLPAGADWSLDTSEI